MKVNNEKTENSQAFLTIEMEPAEMEESLENSYHRLVKKVNVPGFRKGKAPRAVLERHVGQERLLDDTVDALVPQAYEQALQEQEIEAYAQPQIEMVQENPLIFKAVVPLRPVVKLGDYHKVKVKEETVKITKDNIAAVIEQLRHQHATWQPVERPVASGDLLNVDVESTVDGEPFINQKGAQYQVTAESANPVAGFPEQFIGMQKDEEKEFTLRLPEDYPGTEMAGKEASFKVKVYEIKEEELPEVTDEFAGQVDPEFQTVDDLRQRIKADMTQRAEERARTDFEEKVVDAAVNFAELEYPPVLVESEVHRLIDEQARRVQMQGANMEQYLASINKTEEQLHEEMHPVAEQRVARSLVLGKIAEEENVEISDDEINAEIEVITQNAAEENKTKIHEALNAPQARESIRQTLFTRKTMQLLVDIVKSPKKYRKKEKKEEK